MEPSYRIQFFSYSAGGWQQSRDYYRAYTDVDQALSDLLEAQGKSQLSYRVVDECGDVVPPPETQEVETQEPTPDAIEELKKLAEFLYDLRNKRQARKIAPSIVNVPYDSGVITGLDVACEAIIARLEELGVK